MQLLPCFGEIEIYNAQTSAGNQNNGVCCDMPLLAPSPICQQAAAVSAHICKDNRFKNSFLLFFEQFAVCVLVLLNVKHLILLRKVNFYRNLLHSCTTVLSDVFFVYLLNNFRNDCVLQTIFMPKSDATRSVWCAFENYVVL